MSAVSNSTLTQPQSGNFLTRLADNQKLLGFLFVLPSLIGFTIFFAIPAIRSVFISFYEWNLLTDATYIGLENYNEIFSDQRFWRSLGITVTYVLWNIPLQTTLAIFIAVMLNRIHNSSWLRGLMILPWLLPNVVVALLFLWILDPSLGILNVFLQGIGIPRQPFLGSPDQAIEAIAGINIWRHAGYNAILVFAGLKLIPKSMYEAAAIDGASGWTQFWKLTLPLLRPVLVFVVVTSVIGSFQVFDTIAVTTQGGPAGSTRTIIYYIYDQVFERRIKMGTATAACVVLFGILVTVTVIQTRFLRADQSDLADYS
jgi:multiple sugar transport system permease protein